MEDNSLILAESGDIDDITDEINLADLVDEAMIDAIWSDLDGQIDREQVRQTAQTVAQSFASAAVTTFIPLLIRRRTYDRLKSLLE